MMVNQHRSLRSTKPTGAAGRPRLPMVPSAVLAFFACPLTQVNRMQMRIIVI